MYRKIFVPIDGSATAARGLDEAIRLAELTGARLRILHVLELMNFVTCLEPGAVFANDVIEVMTRVGKETLVQARARADDHGVEADTILRENLAAGVATTVVEEATSWGADLIVIGTHGRRGVGRLVLGSDAEAIARTSPVPVLLVRAPAEAIEAAKPPRARASATGPSVTA